MVKVHFAVIDDPNTIFGAVGRCGSGYNTRWADWTKEGRENKRKINDEWYERYDAITGHYSKLEKSILDGGFRNPIILTCGTPSLLKTEHIPPEYRGKKDFLVMEGYDGGSRLWVAQKHNLSIPCIINDKSGTFGDYPLINNRYQLLRYFKDVPKQIIFNSNGVIASNLNHSHMDNEFANKDNQAREIIPLWVELLQKYGYHADVRPQHRVYLKRKQVIDLSMPAKPRKPLAFLRENVAKSIPPRRREETLETKPNYLPPLNNFSQLLKRDSLSEISTESILQIGNDNGELFISLFNENELFRNTEYFAMNGTPSKKFSDPRERIAFFEGIQSMRKNCVINGIKSFSLINTLRHWIDRVGRVKFGLVIIRRDHSVDEVSYLISNLTPFISDRTRIVVESQCIASPEINTSGYEKIDEFEGLLILMPKSVDNSNAFIDNTNVMKKEALDYKSLNKIDASEWDHTAYIVAGGPSLKDFDWSKLAKDKFVVAINQSHKVLPNAQIVYFTDLTYWSSNRSTLLSHKGFLVRGCVNPNGEAKHYRVILMHLTGQTGIDERPGKLKHGLNSTYAAVNLLSAHLGFKKIYLMGVDMSWSRDKNKTHWHDGYEKRTPQCTYNRMMENFKTIKNPMVKMGVSVINVINPECPSKLECFPKITINELFGE